MILHIDHVTVVVRDVQKAKAFFALLGFRRGEVDCGFPDRRLPGTWI
jgi:catechol 2,3-dioxygenase-like lactoylglutathione lyase family enzyme